jgi:hypothetical protein
MEVVMKKLIFITALFLYSHPGFAILSPLNQSIEEIQSIVQNTELQKYFPQDQPIIEVQRSNNGYLLRTRKLQMSVEIEYVPATRPGRQQFKIVFHEPTQIRR